MRLGGSTHLVQAGAGPASSIKEEESEKKKKRSPSPKSESSSYELPSAHHVWVSLLFYLYRMQQIYGATASHSNSFEQERPVPVPTKPNRIIFKTPRKFI